MCDSVAQNVGNTLSVEYGFVTSVANPNYGYVLIFIKIKALIVKLTLFSFVY